MKSARMKLLICAAVVTAALAPASAQHDHHQHAGAAAPPPPLTLAVGPAQGGAGSEADVPILVKGASGIGPMEMVVTYDPQVLAAAEKNCARKGPLLTNAALESGSDASGKMAISWATGDAINGDGVVATAHFTVKGQAGQKSPLGLEKVRAWGRDHPHLDALVAVQPGEFTVSAGGWPWWVFALLAALAALLLLALLLAARRRQPALVPAGVAPAAGPTVACPNPACRRPAPPGSAFCPHCGRRMV